MQGLHHVHEVANSNNILVTLLVTLLAFYQGRIQYEGEPGKLEVDI